MALRLSIYRAAPSVVEEIEDGKLHPHAYFASFGVQGTVYAAAASPDGDFGRVLDLNSSWDVVLFLLSEEYRDVQADRKWEHVYEDPLVWTVFGARLATRRYGMDRPARYSLPEQVRAIADRLDALTYEQFMHAAVDDDAKTLQNCYHGDFWLPRSVDDDRFVNVLHNLKHFYRIVVEHQQAALCHLG